MKRGFTLIELLVVVVVLATLMGIVFRLAGVGDDTKAKNLTVARIQKLEFALSGYYAAFGTYPPVPLQGRSRDIYRVTSETGIQDPDPNQRNSEYNYDMDGERLNKAIASIRAACMAQPVAAEFPGNKERLDPLMSVLSTEYKTINGRFGEMAKNADWTQVRVFKFGLMSYLLPRYLFMMDGPDSQDEFYDKCAQWKENNRLASLYNFSDGTPYWSTWNDLRRDLDYGKRKRNPKSKAASVLTNQPSQSVCARWLPALEKTVRASTGVTTYFYGVGTADGDGASYETGRQTGAYNFSGTADAMKPFPRPNYNDSTSGGNGGQKYQLSALTVVDGWHHDLFYYSPPPYQSYRLWSAGPDAMTFPPWVDLNTLKDDLKALAGKWCEDDIERMKN